MSTEKDNQEMEELSLEEILGELESAITDLESGELTLDQSFSRYQQGMELVKEASSRIDRVEKQMVVLQEKDRQEEETGYEF